MMRKRVILVLLVVCVAHEFIGNSWAKPFTCGGGSKKCEALIDFVPPNSTTISSIKTLFGVKKLQSLLGANNYPLSTPPNLTVPANSTLKIPFQCLCSNGTGLSNRRPLYKVAPGDGLDSIARTVFAGLVTYQEIQLVNGIPDPNVIREGQEVWIPLPCSCDGEGVVHYGHLVKAGSSVDGIAGEYNTTADELLKLNGLASPNDLLAGAVLDVPLPACRSMVGNNSLDNPLLVANNTYVLTATNCVICNCNAAANNWTLQCVPSNGKSSTWSSCPSMQCEGAESLFLGNTTSTGCNRTTCAYAGYTNQTILTTLAVDSTCPITGDNDNNSAPKLGWNILLMAALYFIILSIHL